MHLRYEPNTSRICSTLKIIVLRNHLKNKLKNELKIIAFVSWISHDYNNAIINNCSKN